MRNFGYAVRDSNCLVLIADHSLFKEKDSAEAAPLMKNRNLVDTGNMLQHDRWRERVQDQDFRGWQRDCLNAYVDGLGQFHQVGTEGWFDYNQKFLMHLDILSVRKDRVSDDAKNCDD